MNIKQQIKELRNKLDELEKQVNGKETSGRYIPARLDKYYFLCNNGDIFGDINNGTDTDNYRISIGNCFRTKEDAGKHNRILINTQKLKDLAERLNGKDIDWNDDCERYYIYLRGDKLCYDYSTIIRTQGVIYCLDESFLEKAIAEIGKEELIELIKGV